MKKLLSLTLLCVFFAAPLLQAQPADVPVAVAVAAAPVKLTHPRNHVLLIGVNQYTAAEPSTNHRISASFHNLQFCVKDMQDLKNALIKSLFCHL